jgi:hypothetical protein
VDEFRRLVAILPNPLRFNVDTFANSRQMAERYRYLVEHFPDPADAEGSPQHDPPEEGAENAGPPPDRTDSEDTILPRS